MNRASNGYKIHKQYDEVHHSNIPARPISFFPMALVVGPVEMAANGFHCLTKSSIMRYNRANLCLPHSLLLRLELIEGLWQLNRTHGSHLSNHKRLSCLEKIHLQILVVKSFCGSFGRHSIASSTQDTVFRHLFMNFLLLLTSLNSSLTMNKFAVSLLN